MLVIGQALITSEWKLLPLTKVGGGESAVLSSSLLSAVAEERFALLHSLEDKLVFSARADRMIHAVWYIIKVCELKMSKPGS